MPSASEIRQSFFDFFASKGHTLVPSSPIVLPTDPTLLFANAGMNQFKDIFLGQRESADKRVVNTQKCIRVSGKHNDLEEVGLDTYHHTFFEMLGNWSFGDYYKREAVAWAWELFTGVWGFPKERLWATVYHSDKESEALWKEATDIDPDHILRFGDKDNFWEMAETGPCGPCSEIHIDLTEAGCDPEMVNAGSPEVIELWNLVFIQYNRLADGSLLELTQKHVDTGMGLERIVAVLQGKKSNYDSDLFTPLLRKLEEMTGKAYAGDAAVAMRVIADHIRALSFAVADGVLPANEGRGYVLRRLLRRAVRYGRKLGLEKPFLSELFPIVGTIMAAVFPELEKQGEMITRALRAEEESFRTTLDRGIGLFDDVIAELATHKETIFPGDQAFTLYDTYGFPLDLTVLMASEKGLAVDEERFNQLMEEQRDRARRARKESMLQEDAKVIDGLVTRARSTFIGYTKQETESGITAMIVDGQTCGEMAEGVEGVLILETTPFYAESGGQVGDQGTIRGPHGEFEVWDTQRRAEGIILHIGRMVQGVLRGGETVSAEIDAQRRNHLVRHHTGTHLLNGALRELISETVKQAGSLVAPDRLRFDFTHYEAIPPDKLEAIEHRVNGWIMQNDEVSTYEIPFKEVPGSGIVAVFDEKYGDVVRVVDIGGYSRELCGGTHVRQTGELGLFRIMWESSIASGVRRIEAVCGWSAYEWMQREHDLVRGLSQQFSAPATELIQRVDHLLEQNKKLAKELKQKAAASAQSKVEELLARRQEVGGVPLIAAVVEGQGMEGLRGMLDLLRGKLDSGIVVLGSATDGKAHFVASVSDDLVARDYHAGNLIGKVAKIAGGGGDGQPHKAQAGGKNSDKMPEAIERVAEFL